MEEIVRRLRSRDQKSLRSLKESLPIKGIREEDEIPGDEEEDTLEDDIPEEDTQEEMPDTPDGEEEESEVENPDTVEDSPGEDPENEFVNPLDNTYAVRYKLGQEVALVYSNGTKSKLAGIIDGYDKEGFYRIKWSNGKTTSGITDIALADLVDDTNESKCVCGSDHFVNEGKLIVCDVCGRRIGDAITETEDPLQKADKSRPSGKKLVRSEAHPVSTSIQDSIRNAFKKKAIVEAEEDYEDDEEDDAFERLRSNLEGEFWTRLSELVDDIEELGYTVEDSNEEYVVVSSYDEDDDTQIQIPLGGTSRTMTLDFSRARRD